MKNGKYKVIESIHVFHCLDGQLGLPVGTVVTVNGSISIADDELQFPTSLLKYVEDSLEQISD